MKAYELDEHANGHKDTFRKFIATPVRKTKQTYNRDHCKPVRIIIVVFALVLFDCLVLGTTANISCSLWWTVRTQTSIRVHCDDVSLSVNEDLCMLRDVKKLSTLSGTNICEFDRLSYVVEKATERVYRQRRASGSGPPQYLACGNAKYAENRSMYTAYFSQMENSSGNYNNSNVYWQWANYSGGYIGCECKGGSSRSDNIVNWKLDRNSSFIGDSFVYTKGRVLVNTTSFFYIYCSVTIRLGPKAEVDGPQRIKGKPQGRRIRRYPLYISISKRTTNYNNTVSTRLLENWYSDCDDSCEGTTTLQIGSNLLIDKGDEVFVQISNRDRLVLNSRGNKFGLFKVE